MTICKEHPLDIESIRMVQHEAFRRLHEGQLVDALRTKGAVLLSLVALVSDRVVGHVLYSPVSVGADAKEVRGAGLGPLAVLPEYQRQGIGTALVETGNQALLESACPFIVVLGHPAYYRRFGFKPASRYGIQCEWSVPDETFMVLVREQAESCAGLAHYRQEFSRFV